MVASGFWGGCYEVARVFWVVAKTFVECFLTNYVVARGFEWLLRCC